MDGWKERNVEIRIWERTMSERSQAKLAFDRIGAFLVNPQGAGGEVWIHASLLGEEPSTEQRLAYISDVSSDDPARQHRGIATLGRKRSPEYLDALLHALGMNCAEAARVLVAFVDDPRVRPALVAALRSAPLNALHAFAGAAGAVGGEGARTALRERLAEATSTVGTPGSPLSSTDRDRIVVDLAKEILGLDPDDTDAAEHMAQALRRSSGFRRSTIVGDIVEVLRGDLQTVAMRTLGREIEELLHSEDMESFLAAATVLVRDDPQVVLTRCEAALFEHGSRYLHSAILALARIPFPFTGRALAALGRWVCERGEPIDMALWAAGLVHEILPAEVTEEILRHALASATPSLRLDATRYLEHVAASTCMPLLGEAVKDEPDPLLRREMLRVLGSASGG
jgi:hypothetical protein